MIRPSNIDIENHTADFKCDEHGGTVTALNLNTQTEYTEDSSCIVVEGSVLTSSCTCVTFFPVVGGNQKAQDLASAKTE